MYHICRWLIVGPARSGSSFHVDPNCTSAWNAVVRGSKKWIMFPPGKQQFTRWIMAWTVELEGPWLQRVGRYLFQ